MTDSMIIFNDIGHEKLTFVDESMSIMEENAVVRIWEDLHIIVVDVRQVQLVEQDECVLQMDVVVCDAVHDHEAHILAECCSVIDGGIVVS